ncbi:MAG TPA: hypothetical protein VFQ35_17515, partial [Polyangiaceae bacterium]|nr:hypothetical protein [Polyangiaceae bacterium]
NPFWPLLGSMLAGGWLAWPWFALNSAALGKGKRFDTDLAVLGFGVALNAVFVIGVARVLASGWVQHHEYADLVPQALRLTVFYWLFLRQERTYQLFEHFGGVGRNGLFVVMLGAVMRGSVLALLPSNLRMLLG